MFQQKHKTVVSISVYVLTIPSQFQRLLAPFAYSKVLLARFAKVCFCFCGMALQEQDVAVSRIARLAAALDVGHADSIRALKEAAIVHGDERELIPAPKGDLNTATQGYSANVVITNGVQQFS